MVPMRTDRSDGRTIRRLGFLLIPAIWMLYLGATPATAQVRVVTTLPDLKSIAESIGCDRVEAFAIATGFQNPHFVDPKPSYILALSKADLFVTVGLDLESGWVPPLIESSRNAQIQKGAAGYIDASVGVPLLEIPANVSRSGGDIHVYGNPHYWLDPIRGKIIARNICVGLIRVDPANGGFYRANLAAFEIMIDGKVEEWKQLMAPFEGREIVAYHNEWPYFEERFGFRIVDFLEPKPGIPPTASQLAKVIRAMTAGGLKIIINSPYFKAQSAELVARNVGGTVVTLATSVGAEESIRTYTDLFDHNIALLRKAFLETGEVRHD